MNSVKITPDIIRSMKTDRRGVPSLTVYDYPMTRLFDEAGIPLLLVGDSLGMVVLGYPDTTHVTMEEMEHHVRAAARAKPLGLLAADLPYRAYEDEAQAVANAKRLRIAGAEAVKAEGGRAIINQVRAIIAAGIPYIGHLGMLPQNVVVEGKYRIKGKIEEERAALLADAKALADAGAFAIVLELITPAVAVEISRSIPIPTLGIGSGPDCDGQILVTHDLVGAFPWFTPRFIKPRLATGAQTRETARQWALEVEQHTLKMP
jgi:3-methyl-2-oxobutanoate hydroxymethyltransferase